MHGVQMYWQHHETSVRVALLKYSGIQGPPVARYALPRATPESAITADGSSTGPQVLVRRRMGLRVFSDGVK